MGIEIERKYLVKGNSYKCGISGFLYKQGYLLSNSEKVIRVRVINSKGFITIKSKVIGFTRHEFEYEIPLKDAEEMLDLLCERPLIEKHRYIYESLSASKVGALSDGKSSSSAIPISPTAAEPKKADGTPEENRCRDIVVSPQALHSNVKGRGTSIHAHVRKFGSGGATPITITPEIASLVKGLLDSFNKEELEKARTSGKKPVSDWTSSRKRKRDEKERDNRPGMFTPPGFDLMFSSQETSTPDEPIDANPLAWAASQGTSFFGRLVGVIW